MSAEEVSLNYQPPVSRNSSIVLWHQIKQWQDPLKLSILTLAVGLMRQCDKSRGEKKKLAISNDTDTNYEVSSPDIRTLSSLARLMFKH
jgi:hypothetical protein